MVSAIKKYTLTGLLALLLCSVQAQKYDNIWVLGYFGGGFGLPALDFRFGTPDSTLYYPPFDFANTNASISDSDGNLVLFTNGTQIANRYMRIVAGSDSFNYDPVSIAYGDPDESEDQCALILPFPGHDNQYYVFHNRDEFLDATMANFTPINLQYSVIDMNLDSGMGVMTQKCQAAIADTMVTASMQAVKHANGHDWWVIIHKYNANVFYSVRLSSQGVGQPVASVTGPVYPCTQIGQSFFSPDGAKYISILSDDTVRIADFDRCTGTFAFSQAFSIPYDSMYGYITGGAVSPNSRYLYVNNPGNLFQFDLQASDVANSKTYIGQYDNYGDPIPTTYWHEQLGPDGRIYISTAKGCRHLHVINSPNLAGTACNFVQHQISITGGSYRTLPLMPNFRLDSISPTECDSFLATEVTDVSSQVNARLYPNPTTGNLIIQTQNLNAQTIIIYDETGRPISLMPFKSEIDVSSLAGGVYLIELTGSEGTVRKRIVKL